jgi:hypothetical protein
VTDVTALYELDQQLRADLRAAVREVADDYVLALDSACEAERRWAQDPERDDLRADALAVRAGLEDARKAFDKAVTSAKAVRTRKLNEAVAADE